MGLKCSYSLIYVALAFAFAARLLANHGVIHPDYQTYLPSFSNQTQKVLFKEDASVLSLVGSLVYAALECDPRMTHAVKVTVYVSVDGILMSALLCIVVGVRDVFHLGALVTIYLSFNLLMIEVREILVPRILVFVFWSQILLFYVLDGPTVNKLGAMSVVLLDAWTIIRPGEVYAIDNLSIGRHVVRTALLCSVFFN